MLDGAIELPVVAIALHHLERDQRDRGAQGGTGQYIARVVQAQDRAGQCDQQRERQHQPDQRREIMHCDQAERHRMHRVAGRKAELIERPAGADDGRVNIERPGAQRLVLDDLVDCGADQPGSQHMQHGRHRGALIAQHQHAHQRVPEQPIAQSADQAKQGAYQMMPALPVAKQAQCGIVMAETLQRRA